MTLSPRDWELELLLEVAEAEAVGLAAAWEVLVLVLVSRDLVLVSTDLVLVSTGLVLVSTGLVLVSTDVVVVPTASAVTVVSFTAA